MKSALLLLLTLSSALLWGEEAKQREEEIVIRVVSYANSDSSKQENRLLIVGQSAYRSVDELKKLIKLFSSRPQTHFKIYGTCFPDDPRLTPEELTELKDACTKDGVRFTYFMGG